MFQTLSNVQSGEAIDLQQYVDNCDGCLHVGLHSITFTMGWFNIEIGESFSYRHIGGTTNTILIPFGLYSFTQLQDIIEGAGSSAELTVSKVNGLIILTVTSEWEVHLTDGLLNLLGLITQRVLNADGLLHLEQNGSLGGQWLDAGVYIGDRPLFVDFAKNKVLRSTWSRLIPLATWLMEPPPCS